MKLATSSKIAKMQAHSTLLERVCAIDPYTESIVLLHAVYYEHTIVLIHVHYVYTYIYILYHAHHQT